MRTGLTAFRLSMGKALVPFVFVYTPAVLFIDFQWAPFLSAIACGVIGVIALSAAYIGHFRASLNVFEKAALSIGGVILVFNQVWLNVLGVGVVGVLLAYNWIQARRADAVAAAQA